MHLATLNPIIRAVTSRPWAIIPDRADDIAAVISWHSMGERRTPEEIAAIKGPRLLPNGTLMHLPLDAALAADGGERLRRLHQRRDPDGIEAGRDGGEPYGRGATVGVINVFGIIAQHAAQVENISGPGGTSTERVGTALRMAMADPAISAVVLQVDSPGGNVFGVQELSDLIHSYRGQKPIIAHANSLMASAAYWIGSAADEVVVTPSGEVGSVGVVMLHQDVSQAAEKAGVRFSYVYAGRYKVEGNPYEPLGEEARAAFQDSVDGYYAAFVKGLARNRGKTTKDVLEGFGQGRVLSASDALRAGMVDRIETFDATLRRVAQGRRGGGGRRAELSDDGAFVGADFGRGDFSAFMTLLRRAAPQAFAEAPTPQAGSAAAPSPPPAPPAPPEPGASTDHPQGDAEADGETGQDAGTQDTGGEQPIAPEAPEIDPGDDAAAREREAYRRRRHAHLKRRFTE